MKIGLLNCYQFEGENNGYQAEYEPMCRSFIEKAFPGAEISTFFLGLGDRPSADDSVELWVVTGSAKSAYDKDDWIVWLKQFVVDLERSGKKILGLCFGHQLIAEALGGKVEASPKGWGVGVRRFEIVNSHKWMKPFEEEVSLIYSHRDQVIQLPGEATHLGKSEFCEFEMYAIRDQIFCMQGHPEFSVDFALSRYYARKSQLGEAFDRGVETVHNPNTSSLIWKWIYQFATAN